jgi:hypothetical protein
MLPAPYFAVAVKGCNASSLARRKVVANWAVEIAAPALGVARELAAVGIARA